MSYGIIIGRFQVPELHSGHCLLFDTVMKKHNGRIIVFVGVSPVFDERNPLDFETRKNVIENKYDDLIIVPLPDCKSNDEWASNLDNMIQQIIPFHPAIIYGGRDSCIEIYRKYSNKYDTEIINDNVFANVSSTVIRQEIASSPELSSSFRKGIIYSTYNRYSKVVTTVDIAVLYNDGTYTWICLGQKPKEKKYRFPGGYSEPSSISFEMDAKRECFEETGNSLSDISYIGSTIINDWRYKNSEDKIKTLLFAGWTNSMSGKAGDDLSEIKWFKLGELRAEDFEPEHRVLFQILKGWYLNKIF